MTTYSTPHRILHVITRLDGGSSLHAIDLNRSLNALGCESTLAAGVCEADEEGMSCHLRPGDRVVWIPEMSRSVSPWRNAAALVRLWKLIRELRPEVVHTHTAMAGCLGRAAAFLAGAPAIVHTFHGNSLSGYFSPLVSRIFVGIERMLARVTDRICVVSEQQRRELSERFRIAPGSRFRVTPLGPDLSRLIAMPLPEFVTGCLRVGWFGRLVGIKNVPLLIAVVRATLAATDRIEFHVAGDGPQRVAVTEACREFGPRLVWHGWQVDTAPLIAHCHVLLQTSINEGTPLALIEGMAAGRPFLSTPVGGVVDMVDGPGVRDSDGSVWHSNGVLVKADPSCFARALRSLADRPERLRAMGIDARKLASERYNGEALVANVLGLYRELCEGGEAVEAASGVSAAAASAG
jgi:glycosyltransferase involved in cell wall biosynthesis